MEEEATLNRVAIRQAYGLNANSCRAAYYFFNDVFPPMYDGYRPLGPPQWWVRIFDGRPAAVQNTEAAGTIDEAQRADAPAAARPELPAAPDIAVG